jgi:hypothetical protein
MPANPIPDARPISYKERQMAKLVGVSAKSLYRWRALGLPHVKIESQILYVAASVERWLKDREIVNTEEAK